MTHNVKLLTSAQLTCTCHQTTFHLLQDPPLQLVLARIVLKFPDVLRKLTSAGMFAMVEALIVHIEPALPFGRSEPNIISLNSLTKRGNRSFVYYILLEALVVERTCATR